MRGFQHAKLFSDVDRTNDPSFFIYFMDEADKPKGIAESKAIALARMGLGEGQSVLDLGCGPGADALEMASIVGDTGRVVGIDASEVMVAEARRRAGDTANISFQVAQAGALPFADDSFDACRASRLLEHLADPRPALREITRVTRSGGSVAVLDLDWDTLIIDHPDKETTRTIVRSHSDSMRNGCVGRQLPRLLKQQHLDNVSIDATQIFVHWAMVEIFLGTHLSTLIKNETVSAEQATQWWEALRRANDEGTLLVSFTSFVVAGHKGDA